MHVCHIAAKLDMDTQINKIEKKPVFVNWKKKM